MSKIYFNIMTERSVRKRLQSYGADVVISVHPLMNTVPTTSCSKISIETGKHLPFFTVVTDLASAHCTWFDKNVEKLFIASENIRKLAMERGQVPDNKLVQLGLPIRYDFALEAERLGNDGRVSFLGKKYQSEVKSSLVIETRNTILIMGGGDGLGRLSDIVQKVYLEGTRRKLSLSIVVICGRNTTLRNQLEKFDWDELRDKDRRMHEEKKEKTEYMRACLENPFTILQKKSHELHFIPMDDSGKASSSYAKNDIVYCDPDHADQSSSSTDFVEFPHKVSVIPLGFVNNIAQYMVASDILITKAGPGTIAEAAAVGLPVLLTSFLPGQEEGNVDFVEEKGFGLFQEDKHPEAVATIVCNWLQDPQKLNCMSDKAHQAGSPRAAEDIVRAIGQSVVRWKELNEAS
jgi:1,2-diacylglycerol 3-beta-galactosyltransferase